MPDDPKNPDSLGDDRTFTGEQDAPPDEQQSLGDQATAGDALSSISDLEPDGQASDSDLPLIDLARFEIEGELGKGGMGAVQLATDRQLKRKVAIKRIHASSQSALARFVTEAQSIAALNHFNIVQVHDFGRDADGPLLVMEYVSGGSLLDRLKDGKLEVEDAIGITCQLCDALALAHEQGIIHRDIKPANILLTTRGEPKLTDFGLARQDTVDHGQTQAGAVLGTIDFMPPEQRRDATAVDARSDLWSLAATLYQMLTGSSPRVIRLDHLPANLAPVIGTMLEENPEKRYATAEQFKAELRKGMATAAATVAVDLAAGVCPACNTPNDASRKFCQQCAEALMLPCLSCSDEIAVWHNICGQCGCQQDKQRDLIRKELSTTIEDSLTLARGHEYEQALMQLTTVQNSQHAFTVDLLEQAAEQVKLITAQRDQQYELREQVVSLANKQLEQYNYATAARELGRIPLALRTSEITAQLNQTQAAAKELSALLEQIRTAVRKSESTGLLEKAQRYLKLKPDDEQVTRLHELLQAKAASDRQKIESSTHKAQQHFDSWEYVFCIEVLAELEKTHSLPQEALALRQASQSRLDQVNQLSEQIKKLDPADPSGLPLLEQLILLRPYSEEVFQRLLQLKQRIATKDQQERETLQQQLRGRVERELAIERRSDLKKFALCMIGIVLFVTAVLLIGLLL